MRDSVQLISRRLLSPPPKRNLIGYNITNPYPEADGGSGTSSLAIKATTCKPRYYDEQLIRLIVSLMATESGPVVTGNIKAKN